MEGTKLIEKEIAFCESIDCEKNEFKQFLYRSENGASALNLPYVLLEYKQWLIDQGVLEYTNPT